MKKQTTRYLAKLAAASKTTGEEIPNHMIRDANIINWCDHSHNFWSGCTQHDFSCKHCYAYQIDKRFGRDKYWGKGVPRRKTKTQGNILKRDRAARKLGIKILVFANSMSDFFDEEVCDSWRDEAFGHIAKTTNTIWQLNTKRASKALSVMKDQPKSLTDKIWVGFSVPNQRYADQRLPILNQIVCAKRYVSAEPLLGPIDFKLGVNTNIDQIIGGMESGFNKRDTDIDWIRSIRDQCLIHDVAFYWKQNTDHNGRYTDKLIDGLEYCEIPDHEAAHGYALPLAA
jgi:protein gp37